MTKASVLVRTFLIIKEFILVCFVVSTNVFKNVMYFVPFTGEKPYCCSVSSCQKKFRVVGDLKRHMVSFELFSNFEFAEKKLNFGAQKIHERSKTATSKDKKKEVILSNTIKKEVAGLTTNDSVRKLLNLLNFKLVINFTSTEYR